VTEPGRDDRKRYAGIKHLCGREVTKIVKSEMAEAGSSFSVMKSLPTPAGSSHTPSCSLQGLIGAAHVERIPHNGCTTLVREIMWGYRNEGRRNAWRRNGPDAARVARDMAKGEAR